LTPSGALTVSANKNKKLSRDEEEKEKKVRKRRNAVNENFGLIVSEGVEADFLPFSLSCVFRRPFFLLLGLVIHEPNKNE
jgi:hypothetical protein